MDFQHTENNGLEIVVYDKPDFPVLLRKNYASGLTCFSMARSHWHDDVEFISVLSGSIRYSINGSTVTLRAGEGIFINSRCFHYILSDNGADACFYCAVLHPSLLCASHRIQDSIVAPLLENASDYIVFSRSIPWQAEALGIIGEICKSADAPDYELTVLCCFARIIKLLRGNIDLTVSAANLHKAGIEPLKRMITYIRSHYYEQITLDDIAKAGGLGKTACTSTFKKCAGTTPISFLMRYRHSKAAELLRATDLSITDIAYKTGFSGASYFAENFRKIMGCSPSQYRHTNRKEP